jgi:hypothetical protein
MSKPDIIDILRELTNEIERNPLLDFVIRLKLMQKRIRTKQKKVEIQQEITDKDTLDIISLYSNFNKYIDGSINILSDKIGLIKTDILTDIEIRALNTIRDVIDEITKNKDPLTKEQSEIILKLLDKIIGRIKRRV